MTSQPVEKRARDWDSTVVLADRSYYYHYYYENDDADDYGDDVDDDDADVDWPRMLQEQHSTLESDVC